MKSILSLICFLAFIIVSCGNNQAKQLANTWQVTNIETSTDLADSVKTHMLENSEMMFTKDGNYTTTGGVGADQGSYTLDKEGKTISTISSAGKTNSVYTIEKLTDEELVLENSGNTVTCTAKK